MLEQAVFLVGGRGSRLGRLTDSMPKPCLDVGGRPFIDYLIETAVRHGIVDIVLLAAYRADVLRNLWGETSPGAERIARAGARVRIVEEPTPSGTAGALWHARGLLRDPFLLANGDSYFDINWLDLLTVPAAEDWLGRIALRVVADATRYGRVELAGARVASFAGGGRGGSGCINAGLYVLRRAVAERIERMPASLELDILPALAAAGRLYGRAYDRFFIDIGIPEALAHADRVMGGVWRRPAALLVMDGVVRTGSERLRRSGQGAWAPSAQAAIKLLNDLGYLVIVLADAPEDADREQRAVCVRLPLPMAAELQEIGAHVDCCDEWRQAGGPDDRGGAAANRALARLRQWPANGADCFLISGSASDVAAAKAGGLAAYLFDGRNLLDFVQGILPRSHRKPTITASD
jgi:D-glycero-D-manno-heptose 1,7-bisphosphate phosphatase